MRSASLPEGFFLGQIPPGWNEYVQDSTWPDAHNNRVKVRIPAKQSLSGEIPDKDLPWAIVSQSTSGGNLNGSSVGLWGGEWVIGFYFDEDEQIPVIIQVLSDDVIEGGKIKESIGGSTQFKAVSPYNSGREAQSFQIKCGPKPKEPAKIDKKTIKEATQSSPPAPEPPIVAPAFAQVNPNEVA